MILIITIIYVDDHIPILASNMSFLTIFSPVIDIMWYIKNNIIENTTGKPKPPFLIIAPIITTCVLLIFGEITPKTIAAWNNEKIALYNIQVGRIHLKNNEFDLARRMFEKSMELETSLYVGYYFLGNSFAQESNIIYDNSVELDEDLNDSLEKNEQSQKMKLEAENLLSKAITMWAYFIEYMPEYSWMILPTLKDALQALHRYDDIERFLIQANENHKKNNVDILSHLADFYANKGEIDKALKTINSVLDGNKDSLLARLKKMKINLLKNKENSLSVEVDKLIISLQRDKRFIMYKQSYSDKNMRWLFETNNIN